MKTFVKLLFQLYSVITYIYIYIYMFIYNNKVDTYVILLMLIKDEIYLDIYRMLARVNTPNTVAAFRTKF